MIRATMAFDANAITIPSTMLNWNSAASRPRRSGGAISEMYIGAATVLTPMPRPPTNRAATKKVTFGASALPMADARNRTPMASRVGRRPKRSAGQEPAREPSTVP